jgi:hypothetical protein
MSYSFESESLAINFPVLCIPRVCSSISENNIRRIFEELNIGILDHIDIISKNNNKSEKFNRVYIHFKRWLQSENAVQARERVLSGKEIKIIYDDPWFWKISAYRDNYVQNTYTRDNKNPRKNQK